MDTLAAMRRWLALILLLMFPLQAVQAANTGLYEHLQGSHEHHQHRHGESSLASASAQLHSGGTLGPEAPRTIHADCSVCHLVHAPGLLTAAPVEFPTSLAGDPLALPSDSALRDANGVRPERPKWQRTV